MKTVGQILKEERIKKNLSLEEVERATKIRKKILASLENGDWKNLPSTTFVKGLIKNYGKFLSLDHPELIAFYRREFDEKKDGKKIVRSEKVATKGFRLTPQFVTIGVIATAFVLVLGYLFLQYQSFTGPPLLELTDPKNNIRVNGAEVNVVGRTWEDAILKINGEEVSLSPGGTFSLSVGLNPGVNTITVTAANRFGKISTEKRTVVVDIQKQLEKQNVESNVSITVNVAPEAANLLVEIDGKKEFEGILVAGTEKTFTAKDRIRLVTKNAGSTKVSFNGSDEVLGKTGEEIEKTYQKK
jgi:cytoskeletal protein RodZ